ncbi:MAG: hypothetical protein GXO78_00955 [Calditrichaeota bacterium]|nr:hypothetical protein [Calditrichota bacterium]
MEYYRWLLMWVVVGMLGVGGNGFGQSLDFASVSSLPYQTLQGSFQKVNDRDGQVDSSSGTFYVKKMEYMYLEVTHPIHQIMVIEGNETLIYYPDRKLAFRLKSKNPVLMPFIPQLIASQRADIGFDNLGLKLEKQEFQGDSLISYWISPDPEKNIGRYQMIQVNDLPIQIFYVSPDSMFASKILFTAYRQVDDLMLPHRIITENVSVKGVTIERIYLTDLKKNLPLPPEIVQFDLPDDVTVEEKEW